MLINLVPSIFLYFRALCGVDNRAGIWVSLAGDPAIRDNWNSI